MSFDTTGPHVGSTCMEKRLVQDAQLTTWPLAVEKAISW